MQTIPARFAKTHLPQKRGQVILRDTFHFQWTATLLTRTSNNNHGVSGGWMDFSLDHRLEEGDACVLEVKDSNYECPIILVHICRVVELVDFIPGSRRVGWETAYNIVHGSGHLKLSSGCTRTDTDSDEDQVSESTWCMIRAARDHH